MSKVSVTLNGRAFTIGCEEGQEAYLRDLAAFLDQRVSAMSSQVGQIGDLRLLLMASLTVVDELKDAERRIESLEAHVDRLRSESTSQADQQAVEREDLAAHIVAAAERLEMLAKALESAAPDGEGGGGTAPKSLLAEAGA